MTQHPASSRLDWSLICAVPAVSLCLLLPFQQALAQQAGAGDNSARTVETLTADAGKRQQDAQDQWLQRMSGGRGSRVGWHAKAPCVPPGRRVGVP